MPYIPNVALLRKYKFIVELLLYWPTFGVPIPAADSTKKAASKKNEREVSSPRPSYSLAGKSC